MAKNENTNHPQEPIAIVGVGCQFPKADNADAFWDNIANGRVAFSDIPKSRWNHEIFYSKSQRDVDKAWTAKGSFIDDKKMRSFAALHYGIAPRRLEVMDPQQRLLIEATRWALQDAGYEGRSFPKDTTGVYVGLSTSEFRNLSQARMMAMQISGGEFGAAAGSQALRDALLEMTANIVPTRAFSLAGSLGALAAAAVSQTFDLGGPAYTIDAACASALVAVHDAIGQLRSRLIDCAIAGGAYLNLTPENLVCFTRVGAISPSGVCRPFDARADGFVQSDGIGLVVLRRLEDALRDGDRIHAIIRGTASNNDGRGEGPMSPRTVGQLAALRQAYRDAGTSPATVAYFEAHGTATNVGDPVEVTALGTLLSEAGVDPAQPALLGSVKGNIGHAMSAAGIAGLIKAVKVLEHRIAPPQAGYASPNPQLGLDRWPLRVLERQEPLAPREGHPLRVAVSSFGFGGTNAHLVLEAPESKPRTPRVSAPMRAAPQHRQHEEHAQHHAHTHDRAQPKTQPPQPSVASPSSQARPEAVIITAATSPLLVDHLNHLADSIESGAIGERSLADLAFTLNARRRMERFRAVIGAKDVDHLIQNLRLAAATLADRPFPLDGAVDRYPPLTASPHALIVDGGREPVRPKVALLFPGQGAQRLGLLAGLRERFSVFDEALAEFDEAVGDVLPKPLSGYLYDEDATEDALTNTEVCQPAMAALGLATSALLRSVGVVADVSLGHSLGEFSALANARALTPSEAVRLVAKRGVAMQALKLEDPGTMAAVMADAATVEAGIEGIEGVYLANINNPKQTAISGTHAGVAEATKRLVQAGHDVRAVPVSHAFHSPLLADVETAVEALLDEVELSSPEHVAASCIAQNAHTSDTACIRQVLLDHATARVDFVRGLQQARSAGATIFVQAGAGSMLTAFTRATLGADVTTVTLAALENDGGYEFVRGVATLAALGIPVDFDALYRGEDRQVISLPETPLERETYWVVRDEPQPTAVLDYPPVDEGTRPVVRLGSVPASGNEGADGAVPSGARSEDPGLVALFQKQAELLRSHAEIIAAQNRLLLGDPQSSETTPEEHKLVGQLGVTGTSSTGAHSTATASSASAVVQPSAVQASTVGASGKEVSPVADRAGQGSRNTEPAAGAPEGRIDDARVEQTVLDIIARISAFPRTALRPEQRLIDELGFDSLMVADLGGAIEKAYPESGGIPASLFKMDTTVADVVAHLGGGGGGSHATSSPSLASNATIEASTEAEHEDETPTRLPEGPVSCYRAVPKAHGINALERHDVAGETWLVTEDESPLSAAISAELVSRKARVVRVRFVNDGVATPNTLTPGTLNLWPSAFVEGLPDALSEAGLHLDGLIHASALSISSTEELVNPVLELHPLIAKLRPARISTITALGGMLGLAKSAVLGRNLLQASLVGYTKALARERPADFIRAIDVDRTSDAAETAQSIVRETLSFEQQVEVGFAEGQRWLPELVREDLAPAGTGRRKLTDADVVLITGGAGEVGRAVTKELALARPKAIVLVGRRPNEDEDVRSFLDAVKGLGTPVHYVQADIQHPTAFKEALKEGTKSLGPITVAIHAAGVIEDARVESKTADSIERVMDVKIRGLQSIVSACPKVKDLVFFTSWAGRFGNAGQTDYAAANDLLDRIAINGLGSARTLAIAWPPWASTRMVRSIPSAIRRAMEASGVTFLDDAEGVSVFMDAFEDGIRGAIVVGRELPTREVSATRAVSFALKSNPYLDDHRLKGEPIVPLASATDLIAETFSSLFPADAGADAHAYEHRSALEIRDLELMSGLRADDETIVTIRGREVSGQGRAKAEIRKIDPKAPSDRGQLAYRASLARTVPEILALDIEDEDDGRDKNGIKPSVSLDTFYRDHTFHGPRLRGIRSIEAMTRQGIRGTVNTSKPKSWRTASVADRWTVDPLVVDGSFQLAAYWLHQERHQAGYPIGFERFVMLRPFEGQSVIATVRLRTLSADTFEGDVLYEDADGRAYGMMVGVRGRIADVLAQTTSTSTTTQAKTSSASNGNGNGKSAVVVDAAQEDNGRSLDAIPDENWNVTAFPELEALGQRFQMAELIGLRNPYFHVHAGTAKNVSVVDGVEMVNYSSYNYLGFSGHEEVVKAAQDAILRYGTSVSASRVASGERALHRDLELGIAEHIGVDDSIVFVSGHATNVTTIGHLFDENDIIVHDSLIHDSIMQGIALSGAQRRPYAHGDLDALERILGQVRGRYRRALICAEGIYSMDGDICDLPRLIEIKKRLKSLLLIDEAHSIGVLGPSGRGVGHHFTGVDPTDVDLWMGTLSKSFASCGGYIAGQRDLVRYLKYTAPGFVYSAGITPPNAAAALKSLELMKKHPEIVEQLRQRSKLFLDVAKARGLDTGLAAGAAVVPIIVGNSLECMQLSERLAARAINVQPIVYPAVEDNASRLRFFISALHTEEQIHHTVATVAEELGRIRAGTAPESNRSLRT